MKVNQPPRLVFAGRFAPQKNPVGLVNILSGIKDQPWNCTLIGDGLLRPEIEAAILRNGLQDRIHLTGWIPPEDVIRWFSKSDILFMPSLSEGLPVVGVQALSMGLALVLSRVGGCVDLVQDGINGALLEPSDEAGFGRSLRHLLGNPAALLAARLASRDLAGKFEINTIVSQYEKMLAETATSKQKK
ncbi:MAG: glycosyltransferase [Anaerolineaceae bacterium]